MNAREKAQNLLNLYIEKSVKQNTVRLPNYRILSKEAGVAPATMLKVVRIYREKRILDVSHGKGIRISSATGLPAPAPKAISKWERVSEHLYRDILEGVYKHDTVLPGPKELTRTYGVCFRTLRKALLSLESDGVVSGYKKTFKVVLRSTVSHENTIILIVRGDSYGDPTMVSTRTYDHLRMLENECARNGVKLTFVTCYYIGIQIQGKERIQEMMAQRNTSQNVLGFIVWSIAIESGYLHQILEHLMQYKKPVALLDENGDIPIPHVCTRSNLFRHFSMAISARAGQLVARHLLNRGHRIMASIEFHEKTRYASNRLAGMLQEIDKSGVKAQVLAFRIKDPPKHASVFDPSELLDRIFLPDYIAKTGGRFSVRERIIVGLTNQISLALIRQNIRDSLFPLLEEIIANREITAWIGCNDELALESFDFLRLKEKNVPKDIALAGFDDSMEASMQKLTSYNFNGYAYMHACVQHILRPSISLTGTGSEAVEIEGYISVRKTT